MYDIFSQVLVLFIFLIIGYVLKKSKKLPDNASNILSVVLVYVFSTCNILKTFSQKFTFDYIKDKYDIIIVSFLILVPLSILAILLARLFGKTKYERAVFSYTFTMPNFGYMGYTVMESLYGLDNLLNMMMFAIPLNIYTYTVGYSTLTKSGFKLKRLINPVFVCIIIGMIIGLSEITLPKPIITVLNNSSSSMGPVSMLLAGITIAEFNLLEILKDYRIYITSIIRLLVIPTLLYLALSPIVSKPILLCALVGYSMPCGLNTIVFPKLINENCKIGAGLAVISNTLSIATIPLILHFLIK